MLIRDLLSKVSTDAANAIKEHSEQAGGYYWSCVLSPENNTDRKRKFLEHAKAIMAIIHSELHLKDWDPDKIPWPDLERLRLIEIDSFFPKSEIFYRGKERLYLS